jgi:hypothetical protein
MKRPLLIPSIPLTLVLLALGLALWAIPSHADTMEKSIIRTEMRPDVSNDKQIIESAYVPDPDLLFNANEWSIDVFGLYALEVDQGTYDDGFGAGVGVNYFFNRYFGIGLEGYGWKGDGLISSVSGNAILRYPIEKWHLAPYIIGGIGGNFDADNSPDQINASGGLGVEYRFNQHWGVFTDGRYVITDETEDYAIARLGVRFSF